MRVLNGLSESSISTKISDWSIHQNQTQELLRKDDTNGVTSHRTMIYSGEKIKMETSSIDVQIVVRQNISGRNLLWSTVKSTIKRLPPTRIQES